MSLKGGQNAYSNYLRTLNNRSSLIGKDQNSSITELLMNLPFSAPSYFLTKCNAAWTLGINENRQSSGRSLLILKEQKRENNPNTQNVEISCPFFVLFSLFSYTLNHRQPQSGCSDSRGNGTCRKLKQWEESSSSIGAVIPTAFFLSLLPFSHRHKHSQGNVWYHRVTKAPALWLEKQKRESQETRKYQINHDDGGLRKTTPWSCLWNTELTPWIPPQSRCQKWWEVNKQPAIWTLDWPQDGTYMRHIWMALQRLWKCSWHWSHPP